MTTEKRRFLDVWIVETNTVYREVPYAVVTDWVQQGRLLESDMLRPSGTAEWFPLGSMPAFAAYLPRTEPHRADDQAEALEPVHMDFEWRPGRHDDEDDVDMIPLIDVSLVLLIFFMMTASLATGASSVNVPEATYGTELGQDVGITIGVQLDRTNTPVYSISQGNTGPAKEDRDLGLGALLQKLDDRLKQGKADVLVAGDRELPDRVIKELRMHLDQRRLQGRVGKVLDKVAERTTR